MGVKTICRQPTETKTELTFTSSLHSSAHKGRPVWENTLPITHLYKQCMWMRIAVLYGNWIQGWSKFKRTKVPFFALNCFVLYIQIQNNTNWANRPGISSLHLTHPKHIRTWSSGQPSYSARGAVRGSVPCSRAHQSWYWTQFLPARDSNPQTLGYKPDSLTTRPRLLLYMMSFVL